MTRGNGPQLQVVISFAMTLRATLYILVMMARPFLNPNFARGWGQRKILAISFFAIALVSARMIFKATRRPKNS
jgi:hypothetical protein